MAAVVGNATLAAVHEAEGLFKPRGDEHSTERLAGLCRIYDEGGSLQVLFPILPGLGPVGDLLCLLRGRHALVLAPAGQHFPILRLAEKRRMIEDFFCTLWHCRSPCAG